MKAKVGLFLLPLVCVAVAQAQAVAGFGAVSGTLRDPYGDGLPDTSVVISNATLGVRRTLTTTDDGMFLAATLPPGSGYSIEAKRQGYGTWTYKDFAVTAGSTVSFAVTLQAESETTKVNGGAVFSAAVEDTKFDISSTVSKRQLEGLPDQGRNLTDPVLLAPAVTENKTGALGFRGEGGTNDVVTDGNYTTNTYFYQTNQLAPQLKPDGIVQMQVIPVGASAEFGHAIGGTINAVTPSGTTNYHGALYDFFSDHQWDAADRFAPGFYPAQRWQQGGASVGGPLLADKKLYFFANFEAWNGRAQGLNQLSNSLLGGPYGALLWSNCKATLAQCTAAINFLAPQTNAVVQRSTSDWTGLGRVDYRPNDVNNLSLEGNVMHGRSPNGVQTAAVAPNGELLGDNGIYTDENRFAKADWQRRLGGSVANELRVGWYKDRVSDSLNPALEPSTGPLAIDIAGASVGSNPAFPMTVSEQRYQAVDNFTWSSLSHLLKFGGEISRNTDWTSQLYNGYGSYQYPSITAFATDFTNSGTARNYSLYSQAFPNGVTNLASTVVAAYGQDEWRASKRLNVMLGVRWEKYLVPQPPAADVNTTYYQTGSIGSPSNAFAPRVGVNYLLNDKTVVRAGVGFYYQPFTGELLRELWAGNGMYGPNISVTPNESGAPVFPKVVASSTTLPNGTMNILYANNKLKLPYAEVGTAGIERRLTSDMALAVNYIESRGTKLWTATDVNLAPSTVQKVYTIDDANGNQVNTFTTPIWTTRSDTTHAHVYELFNEGLSRYRGVTVQLRKAMAHGLSAQISYTFSHAYDDVSGPPAFGFIPQTTFPGDYRSDEGNSNFDQRHRGVINWTWAPRLVHGDSTAARFFLNGWQLTGVATVASGLPETPLVVLNGSQFAGVTMLYPTSLTGSGGWDRVPFQAPNNLITQKQYMLNARITRELPFTERIRGMLIFEAYNALNHQFNTSLNTVEYVATSGVLHPVTGFGTGNAATGYPFGTNARYCQVAFRLEF